MGLHEPSTATEAVHRVHLLRVQLRLLRRQLDRPPADARHPHVHRQARGRRRHHRRKGEDVNPVHRRQVQACLLGAKQSTLIQGYQEASTAIHVPDYRQHRPANVSSIHIRTLKVLEYNPLICHTWVSPSYSVTLSIPSRSLIIRNHRGHRTSRPVVTLLPIVLTRMDPSPTFLKASFHTYLHTYIHTYIHTFSLLIVCSAPAGRQLSSLFLLRTLLFGLFVILLVQ